MSTRPWRLDRRTFLGATAAQLALPRPARSEDAEEHPRGWLILVGDDHSRDDLGVYGHAQIRTPTLDALAAEGVRFERAYVPTSLCQPSRSVIYTGLYPHANGAVGFEDITTESPTWPELLRAAGIATAEIGKLNVGPLERFPFDVLLEARNHAEDGREHQFFERGLTDFLAGLDDRPFVATMNLYDPHRPFYRGSPDQPELIPVEDVRLPAHEPDTRFARLDRTRYWGAVERLDTTVSRLLAVLEQSGRSDSTVVVYVSDNGRSFPFAKSTLYEAGTNVPLIVRWPGRPAAGSVDRDFATTADLLPTVLDSFGLDAPTGLDGASLLDRFQGRPGAPRSPVVTTIDTNHHGEYPARAVRTERFKYIANLRTDAAFESSTTKRRTWKSWEKNAEKDPAIRARMDALLWRPPEELYDLDRDPFELHDVAAATEHRDALHEARALLRTWMTEHRDPRVGELPF